MTTNHQSNIIYQNEDYIWKFNGFYRHEIYENKSGEHNYKMWFPKDISHEEALGICKDRARDLGLVVSEDFTDFEKKAFAYLVNNGYKLVKNPNAKKWIGYSFTKDHNTASLLDNTAVISENDKIYNLVYDQALVFLVKKIMKEEEND